MLLKELFENSNEPLKAPNGQPSNLNSVQYQMVRTQEFKAWFGDWENNPKSASKIIDENGEPLVVYHGTTSNITSFDYKISGTGNDKGMRGRGFYFTPHTGTAGAYGRDGSIMPVFLYIKHPFQPFDFQSASEMGKHLNYDNEWDSLDEIIKFNPSNGEFSVPSQFAGTMTELLKDANYDGILYPPAKEIIAFYPNQIKSAIGNTGKFSSESPHIHEGTICY